MSGRYQDVLVAALAHARTRSSWNARLEHWQRPASDHEEAKIARAAMQARSIVTANRYLTAQGATVAPQGSYFNNTNVRLEADMDLRIQLPYIKTECYGKVDPAVAVPALGYIAPGGTFQDLVSQVRRKLETDLVRVYGRRNVDTSGNKAITIKGLNGSRADCDLVPTFHLHVIYDDANARLNVIEGVGILGQDGAWTMNFPDQHHENGKAKRARTAHRFKKCVRMLKRLNYELTEWRYIPQRLPSFFIESLVYAVEDAYFLVGTDDHYDRLVRIVSRMKQLLTNPAWVKTATEINEIKLLFGSGQAWNLAAAKAFVDAALLRLEA